MVAMDLAPTFGLLHTSLSVPAHLTPLQARPRADGETYAEGDVADTGSGPNGHLSVTTLEVGGGVRILVDGELDLATVPRLNAALLSVEQNGHRSIALDLEALAFMDASGLTAILSSRHRVVSAGKTFTVESCRGNVARVFTLTGQEAVLAPGSPEHADDE